VVQN